MTDSWRGDGGRTLVEKDSGEAGLVFPREEGRDVGGDSRNRVGSLGEGARGSGELGLEYVRGLLVMSVSTGAGLAFRLPPCMDEEEDLGD